MTDWSEPEEHVDLFGFVRGELASDEVLRIADHLRACAACRDELVDTAVGNAVLIRAARTESATPSAHRSPAPSTDLPALPALELSARRTPRRRLVAIAAAAAAVAVVASVGAAVVWPRSDDEPPQPAQQVAALAAVDGSDHGGEMLTTADGDGTRVTLVTDRLPAAAAGSFYQAWLLDPGSNKMLALGPLSGSTSRFRVDNDLMAAYSVLDVSLELDDGDPQHSATSVLQGDY